MKPTRGPRAFTSSLPSTSSRSPRPERVAQQLRQELSQLMVREMKDPRVRMASISEVRIKADLRTAKVMVSAIGDDAERRAVVTALRHAQGYLRAQLGGRLENLKYVPKLNFELDESIAYSVHIAAVLRDIEQTDSAIAEAAESMAETETDAAVVTGDET